MTDTPPVISSAGRTTDTEIVEIGTECTKCGAFFRREVPRRAWDTRTVINCETCQPSLGMH